ncbi:MAG: hypothetical protein ACXVYB_00165 [Arthrobacter sp.]
MSMSGQSLDRDEVKEIVKTGLNSGNGDGEWSALIELADMVGLEYDEEENKYK